MNDMDKNEKKTTGKVFSIGKEKPPIPGCTVSKAFGGGDSGITYFSLAENTDISAESWRREAWRFTETTAFRKSCTPENVSSHGPTSPWACGRQKAVCIRKCV